MWHLWIKILKLLIIFKLLLMQYHCLHVTGIMSPLIMSDVGLMLMWTDYFLDNMYFIASRCRKFFCSYSPSTLRTRPNLLYCVSILLNSSYILRSNPVAPGHSQCTSWDLQLYHLQLSLLWFFKISASIMKSFITAGLISVVYLLTWLKLDLKLGGGSKCSAKLKKGK